MNKSFTLFLTAAEKPAPPFDLEKLFSFEHIKQAIDEFKAENAGKGIVDTIESLPEFIYKELMADHHEHAEAAGGDFEKHKAMIKQKLDTLNANGQKPKGTRLNTVPSSSGETREFYRQVLTRLGAPVTDENIKFFEAWHTAESGAFGGGAAFNPFNTTMKASDQTSNYNWVGVKNYTSKEEGIDATVRTLRLGYYRDIVNALRRGDDPMGAAVALAHSPWGTRDLVVKVLSRPGFSRSNIAMLPKDTDTAIA